MIAYENRRVIITLGKGKMKKRNIIIISVSLITLLFGGLVSLAINTFPELIEEEQEKIEQSPNEDVLFDLPSLSNDKEKDEPVVLTSGQAKNSPFVANFGDSSSHSYRRSSKEFTLVSPNNDEIKVVPYHHEPTVEITPITNTSSSNSSNYYKGVSHTSSAQESSFYIKKEEKQEVIHHTPVSSDAIMNTTIMAIGLCEVLSFVLVMKRKRHLRLR